MISLARIFADDTELQRIQKEPIAFTAVCDEEGKDLGAERLARSGLIGKYRSGIVLEPTSLQISIAQKGFVDFQLTSKGKAAHSSRPHLTAKTLSSLLLSECFREIASAMEENR